MSVQVVRIAGRLPEGFTALKADAEREGHRNLTRLAEEWQGDPAMFVALLAAFLDGELVGIGGITHEPGPSDEPAVRMRRLYVALAARRQGVAQAIANALIQEAFDQSTLVTVHAGADGAAAFWEAMGFARADGRSWSHELRRH